MPSEDRSGKPWRVIAITNLMPDVFFHRLDRVLNEAGHSIVGVLTTAGPKSRRSLDYQHVVAAVPPSIDIVVSNHPAYWAAMFAPLQPDLIISCGFPWRIPKDLIDLPTYGSINLHPALLPKGRGPGSIAWNLRNGDPEMGLTVHYLDEGFDTGNILVQRTIPIYDEDDFESVTNRLDDEFMNLTREALVMVANNDPGTIQNEDEATYYPLFDPEWRIIDWNRPAREVHFQVRSWTGERDYPLGAIGTIDGNQVQVIRTTLAFDVRSESANASPGTVLSRNSEQMVVQCGDGPLAILKWNIL